MRQDTLSENILLSRFKMLTGIPFNMAGVVIKPELSRTKYCAKALMQLRECRAVWISDNQLAAMRAAAKQHASGKTEFRVTFFPEQPLAQLARIFKDSIMSMRMQDERKLHGFIVEDKTEKQTFAAAIIKEILSPAFVIQMQQRNLEVRGELRESNGLPRIDIHLWHQGKLLTTIAMDGWSGMIFWGWPPGQEVYKKPNQVRSLIWQAVEKYASCCR
ncbi:MAG: hypothetical protein WC454_10005 [Phycisphaerae bacterium]